MEDAEKTFILRRSNIIKETGILHDILSNTWPKVWEFNEPWLIHNKKTSFYELILFLCFFYIVISLFKVFPQMSSQ